MHDLGTFGGENSTANAINNIGQIVGYADVPGSDWHAFVYSGGSMHDLGTLYGGSGSEATSINDLGQVVGSSYTSSGAAVAFFYSGSGSIVDLNTLIRADSGWTLEWATGINDSGQIVGYGSGPTGQTDAFLLTPIPEPSTLVLLVAGGLELLGFALRRSADWKASAASS